MEVKVRNREVLREQEASRGAAEGEEMRERTIDERPRQHSCQITFFTSFFPHKIPIFLSGFVQIQTRIRLLVGRIT